MSFNINTEGVRPISAASEALQERLDLEIEAHEKAQKDLSEALNLLLRLFPPPSHLDHDAVVALLRKHGRHGNRYHKTSESPST